MQRQAEAEMDLRSMGVKRWRKSALDRREWADIVKAKL